MPGSSIDSRTARSAEKSVLMQALHRKLVFTTIIVQCTEVVVNCTLSTEQHTSSSDKPLSNAEQITVKSLHVLQLSQQNYDTLV